jgi:XRE family transcriptional regulator, fatty acid utilization regulator
MRAAEAFGLDAQFFADESGSQRLVELREALAGSAPEETISRAELSEIASNLPAVARALIAMHRRAQVAADRADALASQLGASDHAVAEPLALLPYEEVRDFFYTHRNYLHELDSGAERIAGELDLPGGDASARLGERLAARHRVRVALEGRDDESSVPLRRYDARARLLTLSAHLLPGQSAFQMATQLAFLEASDPIDALAGAGAFSSSEARRLARIGLAHYFAGAVLMPYAAFLESAERVSYDIERLQHRFGVGFEPICHRLSTLQRPSAQGVPFFFVRVDRAGNVSKRQSATAFHFSRVGGTCPLWNVYEAFEEPGRILRQLAQLPDGRVYLWIARTVSRGQGGGYGAPRKTFAIGLGCDVRHASRLVYSRGLDLDDPQAPTPIGVGCKLCERASCPQRAFPALGRRLAVDENTSRFDPYPGA